MDIATESLAYQEQLETTRLARELHAQFQIDDQALEEYEQDLKQAKRAVQNAHRDHQLELLR